ncbi:capsule biosynthesis protein [Alitabrizicola rongguiensis]|uniref:capsule biosynthesis protein n=1 Tax=Alitabrizicola rongguiensis TaxID=2909234 RepID=UPI001F2E0A24|nr:capsule biosynthesis protein [Tabrizicola rongguiensis]
MKPKVQRFRFQKTGAASADADAAGARIPSPTPPAAKVPPPPRPPAEESVTEIALAGEPLGPEMEIDAIRREGLTGRQLRMARRMAQRHDLPATSDFDAVRLLRKAGIDPFERSNLLELVAASDDAGGAMVANRSLTEFADPQLPQTYRNPPLPSTERRADDALAENVMRIQQDIAARRKRKAIMLAARLAFLVLLPTIIAGWFYYFVATPLYQTESQMVIQQADGAVRAGAGSGFAGLFGGAIDANKDSIAVQGYLQSRDAMLRLDKDLDFRGQFSGPEIDPLLRLAPDATNEAMYGVYKRMVKVSYDPTEGLINMSVLAPDPKVSEAFSKALIRYAEEQIDHLTQRKREDQMRDARTSFEDAQAKLLEAQREVVNLQEKHKVLSSQAEATLITAQIAELNTQITIDKLSLDQMKANPQPNKARMEPIERRIAAMEKQVEDLRAQMTEANTDGVSLPEVQSELLIAEANVQTRQLMLSATLEQLEGARLEANRQVRYLSVSTPPVAPDSPTFPRAFENTLVTLLIFLGIYLMISMTAAILREQVSA